MTSLKPKEGGSLEPPAPPSSSGKTSLWIPLAAAAVLAIAIAAVAYSQYSSRTALEERIAALESQLGQNVALLAKVETKTGSLASDINVVTEKVGVTGQELASARSFAERLRQEQEKTREQLASELATKASAAEVAANVAAARDEATAKVAEVQKVSETRIGAVSGEVKTVASNLDATRTSLEATRQDLAASRRDLVDVKNTLSDQIARNSGELATLRLKGEKDFFEFDIRKGKKNEMQRVADIRLELRDTDTKKQKYNIIIQVDDNKLEKKDRLANEPVQFLVGRDRLRYEIVVNQVDKDRIRGYVSAPKDKILAAERPVLRD